MKGALFYLALLFGFAAGAQAAAPAAPYDSCAGADEVAGMGTVGSQPDALYRCTTTGATRQWMPQSIVIGQSPTTCNAINAGRLYWDSASSALTVCNGTSSLALAPTTDLVLGSTPPNASPHRASEASTGLYSTATGTVNIAGLGSEIVRFIGASGQVNYLQLSSATAGNSPTVAVSGSDTNISINLTPAGTGKLNLTTGAYQLAGNNALAVPVATSLVLGNSGGTSMTGAQNTAVGYHALHTTTTGTDNVAAGYNAQTANTVGQYNVAIGSSALATATGLNSTVGIGYQALNSARTTATGNTAIGYQALQATTTGRGNSALGYQALTTNTTGIQNTAIGNSALKLNTSGGNNVMIGYNAGSANTTGTSNVAVGSAALAGSTTGIGNNMLGYQAGTGVAGSYNDGVGYQVYGGVMSGSFNTAFGYQSQLAILTASYNASFGGLSLYNITSGNNNAGFGYASGKGITTGSNNLTLGYFVGGNTLSTGSNNILIGTSSAVDTPAANTSNWLNIGNTIYGDMSGSKVGVAQSSPQATLDVNGYLRLAKNSAQPVACSATNDGALALTSQYTLCACKGGTTSWVLTTDGSSACTW